MHMRLGFILDSGLEEEGNLALHGVFSVATYYHHLPGTPFFV